MVFGLGLLNIEDKENDGNNNQVRSVESVPRERDRIFKVIDVAQVL